MRTRQSQASQPRIRVKRDINWLSVYARASARDCTHVPECLTKKKGFNGVLNLFTCIPIVKCTKTTCVALLAKALWQVSISVKIKIKICYNNDAIANHVPILSLLRLEYCIALTVHFKKITLFTTLKGPPQIKPIRSLLPCKALVVFDDN